MAASPPRWLGRASAALVSGFVVLGTVALCMAGTWPSSAPLERLYAGVFLGVAAWLATLCWTLLAPDMAWRRAVAVLGGALLAFVAWRLFAGGR